MAFLGIFGNYDKPGPGVSKDEPPKAAPVRFFEIFFRKWTKLIQANLIFLLPTLVAVVLMVALQMVPTQFVLQLPTDAGALQLNVWVLFVMPFPLVLLSPFTAGLTFITRNFAREEHAFVWSDFWSAVKNNWKYFLINGVVFYLLYVILGFSMIYYYSSAMRETLFFVPFWLCVVLSILLLFAQYYVPMMIITFDLKLTQIYRNAMIFSLAGLGRNLLITVILAGLLILVYAVIPMTMITLMILVLYVILFAFSLTSYFINFTIYPVIERYLIKPYEQKLADEKKELTVEEKYAGLFSSEPAEEEEDDEKEKYVYINGKLVKKSELPEDDK